MKSFTILLIFAYYFCGVFSHSPYEDSQKSIAEYVISYNCSFDSHNVITQDGYILSVWHISKRPYANRPPVLLMHGLMDNGFSWLFKVWERNIVAVLLEGGFDVWIGNNRGNIHSLQHVNSSEYNWREISGKFWDFCLDEFAAYDFPAMVNYIIDYTGYSKIHYIGHSQGTTQFFIKGALDIEFINQKIASFVGLGPVLFPIPLNQDKIPANFTHKMDEIGAYLLDQIRRHWLKNMWVIPGMLPLNSWFVRNFPQVMVWIVRAICGPTQNQTMDTTRLGVGAMSEPGGTSMQDLTHWAQLNIKPGLRMFDFGREENIEHYGIDQPPVYKHENLKRIKAPMFFAIGMKDTLVMTTGWKDMLNFWPKSMYEYKQFEDYGHLDYAWADNAHIILYPDIVNFLKSHNINKTE